MIMITNLLSNPTDMASLVLYHCSLVLSQLLDYDHHLQSQIPTLGEVSWTGLGADISITCSSPCLSRGSSFGYDVLL